ncbi:methionine--tRNA ligase [Candidatus Nomurabacteria bacterium]|nr:MAG: methionine--tRNA ligase [Candidatus Nomurabacteria bacterium]
MSKPFYITTTLPYVNAELHMGHALEFIRADAIARYKMLMGHDVFFNSGTDEHGSKIFKKAEAEGKAVQAFVDDNVEKFYASVKVLGLTESVHFIRTTEPKHVIAAEEFWKRVKDNGYIYKKSYETKYCVGCEEEKTDSELVEGKCPIHPHLELELINEENYFFKFSAFGDKLLAFYEKKPNFVIPEFRFNEMKAFIKGGLRDFSISRLKSKMEWGIPVPGDPEQVMYVWFDALVNYIATVGWPNDTETFTKYWVDGTPTQYCGKDNTRFQSVMWQAMLMAAELPNSDQIVVNGFITAEGGVKMSKSLGNVVDPKTIAEEYGTEALRFFLLSEVSSFEDSPFTIERFRDAYNAKLANGIGNLTSRIMKMATTHLEKTPAIPKEFMPENWIHAMERFDIKEAMDITFRHVSELDQIIQSKEPFKLVKTDKDAAIEIIKDLVLRLYAIAEMLHPMMPETSKKIKETIKAFAMPEPLFLRKE